jgi:hypothetical protein
MTSITTAVPAPAQRRFEPRATLAWGAPLAALLAGVGAEYLDFRELRVLFLLGVGIGVLATSYALFGARPGARRATLTALVGVLAWGAAEAVYVVLHALRGELFLADRFGPQPVQAVALVGVHALFLGLPTGIAAAAVLQAPVLLARVRKHGTA